VKSYTIYDYNSVARDIDVVVGRVNSHVGSKLLERLTQQQSFASQKVYILIHTAGTRSNYFDCLIQIAEI
jgi:hypothetical protein